MNLIIHRGTHEIGGSCVEIKAKNGQRIIVDIGLPLDAESNDKKYLPAIAGLDGKDTSLLAIIISHPHLDHFGLLAHVSAAVPVFMGVDARRILTAAAPFLPGNWPVPAKGGDFKDRVPVAIGAFTITPFLVDHSAYDAYALLIEADGKKIFYSGDIRAHGRKAKLTEKLILNPPRDIDVLLLEGSSLGRIGSDETFPTEADIEQKLVNIFQETKELALVHASAQNIDRFVSIFRACKRTGRTLVIDLYTAVILEATGNKNIPQSDWPEIAVFIPQSQRVQIKNNRWFDILKRHEKNRIFIETLSELSTAHMTIFFRPVYIHDLEKAQCLEGAAYVYSQYEGYWEKPEYARLRNWLEKNHIDKISLHTSGHASPSDLKRLARSLNPGVIIPIHTFTPERYIEYFGEKTHYLKMVSCIRSNLLLNFVLPQLIF